MILVDADVWIDYFANSAPGAPAVERLLVEHRALLSVITVFELFCGARSVRQRNELETLVGAVEPLVLTSGAARRAAAHYARLKSQGRLIGNQDLLLAGTALELDIPLLTRNHDHFQRIEGLELIHPTNALSA